MNANFKLNGKIINTDRLVLRPFKDNDLNDFYEYAKVPGVGEMAGFPHHKSIDESKTILDIFISDDKVFAITLKDSGKVIGSLGVEKYGPEEDYPDFKTSYGRELGFVISKDYWNNGYATEACKAVIKYLFDELNYDFIMCCHDDENEKSKNVQIKCGFTPYRHINRTTIMGTQKTSTMNILLNPNKN